MQGMGSAILKMALTFNMTAAGPTGGKMDMELSIIKVAPFDMRVTGRMETSTEKPSGIGRTGRCSTTETLWRERCPVTEIFILNEVL